MITPSLTSIQSIPTLVQTFPTPAIIKAIPGLGSVFKGMLPKDQVAMMTSDGATQLFPTARIMKVNVSPTSKLMDHPIEDGSIRTDFRIVNPVEMELSIICTGKDYKSTYQQIKASFIAGDYFTIKTKADSYFNMMIESIPHDEIPDMFDVIALGIKMREVVIVKTQYQPQTAKSVKHPNDQSKIKVGDVAPVTPPASILSQITTGASNYLKALVH